MSPKKLAAVAAPLLMIAAGSPLEAQVYRDEVGPEGESRKVVRDVERYFPLGKAERHYVSVQEGDRPEKKRTRFGIPIVSVKPGSPAENAGLKPGDVLVSYKVFRRGAKRIFFQVRPVGASNIKHSIATVPEAFNEQPTIAEVGISTHSPKKESIIRSISLRIAEGQSIGGQAYLKATTVGDEASDQRLLHQDRRGLWTRGSAEAEASLLLPFPLTKNRRWTAAALPLFSAWSSDDEGIDMVMVGFTDTEGYESPSLALAARWKDRAGLKWAAKLHYQKGMGLVLAELSDGLRDLKIALTESVKTPSEERRHHIVPLSWSPPTAEQALKEGRKRALKGFVSFYVFTQSQDGTWHRQKYEGVEGGRPRPQRVGDHKGHMRQIDGHADRITFHTGALLLDCGPEKREGKPDGCFMLLLHADGRVERVNSFDIPEVLGDPEPEKGR